MDFTTFFNRFHQHHHGVLSTSDLQTIAKFIEFLKQPSGIIPTPPGYDSIAIGQFNARFNKAANAGLSFQEAVEEAMLQMHIAKGE